MNGRPRILDPGNKFFFPKSAARQAKLAPLSADRENSRATAPLAQAAARRRLPFRFRDKTGKPGFRGRFLAARPLNGRHLELPIQMARGQARTPMLSYCAGAASACRGNGPPLETALAAVRNRLV